MPDYRSRRRLSETFCHADPTASRTVFSQVWPAIPRKWKWRGKTISQSKRNEMKWNIRVHLRARDACVNDFVRHSMDWKWEPEWESNVVNELYHLFEIHARGAVMNGAQSKLGGGKTPRRTILLRSDGNEKINRNEFKFQSLQRFSGKSESLAFLSYSGIREGAGGCREREKKPQRQEGGSECEHMRMNTRNGEMSTTSVKWFRSMAYERTSARHISHFRFRQFLLIVLSFFFRIIKILENINFVESFHASRTHGMRLRFTPDVLIRVKKS